jgi:hypothetical protein
MVLGLDNRFVETGFLRVVAVRDGYGVTSSHDRPEGTSSLRRCWPACFACPAKGAGVRLCLSTPLLLSKTSQQADHTFTFDQLFNNIIRRYKTIALHYGDSEPIAPKRLTEQASKVSISDKHVFSVAYSQRLCSPGILGHVDFVGDITPFIPWLELGSLLHIGKKLSMGYGAFQLKYLD